MNSEVPVAWADPFGAYIGRVYRASFPQGLSLDEIVSMVPDLPDDFIESGTICVNSEPVPRHMWKHVRPKCGAGVLPVSVTLHASLRDGGNRKNVFALIAAVTLVAVSTAITAGALGPAGLGLAGGYFAAGSTSATILAGSISVIGSLAIAALTAPPSLSGGEEGRDPKGSASVAGNALTPGGTLPRVVGTHRIFPSFACLPLVEIIDGHEHVEVVYALAGPHELEDIRVGGGSIADADAVEVETREGWDNDTALTLVTRQGRMREIGSELVGYDMDPEDGLLLRNQTDPEVSIPQWVPLLSGSDPDEIWIHIYFPAGIHKLDAANSINVPVRIRMRPAGETTWRNLPEIHFADDNNRPIKAAVKMIWGTAGTTPEPPVGGGPHRVYAETEAQSILPPTAPAWTANAHFISGTAAKYMNDSLFEDADTRVRNTHIYDDRVEFFLGGTDFPQSGVWEIQIKRGFGFREGQFGEAGYTIGGVVQDPFWYRTGGGIHQIQEDQHKFQMLTALQRLCSVWNEHPIGKVGMALIAVRAVDRSVSELSVLASGYVQDLDAGNWDNWITTSNPAPHMRDVLIGTQTVNALDETQLDDDQFVAFRSHCISNGFECNTIFDGQSIAEVLDIIAGCGYGRPYKSELWGVIIDKSRVGEAPVQIFSPRNSKNFGWEKAFANIPHGFIVSFRNSARNYEEDQTVVYRSGFSAVNATHLETVFYLGLVTQSEAEDRAAFDLEQAVLRSAFYHVESPIEALVCRRGDLIGLQHDSINRHAGSARVKEKVLNGGNVTGLILDSVIPVGVGSDFFGIEDVFVAANIFADTADTGVLVRLQDGSVLIKQISDPVGYADEITFTTPFTHTTELQEDLVEGCLLVSGELNSEVIRLLVFGVRPSDDYTAAVTFVDEAPELFS